MVDILEQLNVTLVEALNGTRNMMAGDELKLLLFNAINEIDRLRKENIDLRWQTNPDRMGGQFTVEELNRNENW